MCVYGYFTFLKPFLSPCLPKIIPRSPTVAVRHRHDAWIQTASAMHRAPWRPQGFEQRCPAAAAAARRPGRCWWSAPVLRKNWVGERNSWILGFMIQYIYTVYIYIHGIYIYTRYIYIVYVPASSRGCGILNPCLIIAPWIRESENKIWGAEHGRADDL